eukprot:TRINITY_DN3537_c0_g1_i1.p1 TRINITY_DN3537_c0_g1~~TRINITY_DN3537_c0_g1_i1.p1  ORF type:complete len:174 (+),score=34.28 TRINITY_DN3537_c0_g1_i1:44-565(+)
MDALKEIVLLREIPAVLFSHEHHFAFPTESLSDASLIVRDWIVPYVQILIFHEILYAVVFGIPTLLLFSPFGRHGWMREWKYMPDSYPKSSQIFAEIRRTCFSSAMIDAAYSALFLGWRARTKGSFLYFSSSCFLLLYLFMSQREAIKEQSPQRQSIISFSIQFLISKSIPDG